jgi:pimeloyl-ACP methyl ester carboxylesterase
MYLIRGAGGQEGSAGGADPWPGASGGRPPGPSPTLLLTEPIRGLADLAALPLASPWLATAPRGDGHGVLVLPGLLGSDRSTLPLRRFLRLLGYDARGWGLGRNRGPTEEVLHQLPRALTDHVERTGGAASLVGWSLGGIFAREIARLHPGQVRQVITLGSPFAATDRWRNHADGPYRRLSHLHAAEGRVPSRAQVARPIRVRSTSVYSRQDGIVSWQACVDPETALHENVEVRCSHLGFGVDPATLWLIADRLALPAGQHRPFRPPPLMRPLYPGR